MVREQWTVWIAIAALCALAWAYTINLAAASGSMGAMAAMPAVTDWTWIDFTTMFTMWSVMMVAMMLPSATPMILLFATVTRKQELPMPRWMRIGLFVGGYLVVWTAFSIIATVLNWGLHTGGYLTSTMGRVTPLIGGIALVAAGLYQWTTLKYVCLDNCRSPVGFLTTYWRNTTSNAFEIGVRHGAFCFGCCWLLMILLFVLGVMNLVWIVVLTVFVLLEKVIPHGRTMGRVAGVLMVGWGGWLIAT